jgi:hypothetical protein
MLAVETMIDAKAQPSILGRTESEIDNHAIAVFVDQNVLSCLKTRSKIKSAKISTEM